MPAEGTLRDGAAAGYRLIETMRWEPAGGFLRLERHLRRLYRSAAALGFRCDPEAVGAALGGAVAGTAAPLRIRLSLEGGGEVAVTVSPFEPLPESAVWRLRLARVWLDAANPMLRHKTDRREIYVEARREYAPAEADEVLVANGRGQLCEGTITNIFADFGDGVLATPALGCGLLPGILREELLEDGRAREAVFSFDELHTARTVFVGNSLRGLIRARLD